MASDEDDAFGRGCSVELCNIEKKLEEEVRIKGISFATQISIFSPVEYFLSFDIQQRWLP